MMDKTEELIEEAINEELKLIGDKIYSFNEATELKNYLENKFGEENIREMLRVLLSDNQDKIKGGMPMKLVLNSEKPINGRYSFGIEFINGIHRCKVKIHNQIVLVIDLPSQFKFPVCESNDIGCSLFLEFREINSSDLFK